MSRAKLCIGVLITFLIVSCATFSHENEQKALLHLQIGVSLLASGKNPQALSELLQAEKLNSHDPNIQRYLAVAYSVRKRYELAEEHFKKALSLDSRLTEARYDYALMLIDVKRYSDAVGQLNIAREDLTYAHPERVLATLALVQFQKRSYPKAIEFLQQASALKSDDCVIETLFGRTLFEMKNYSDSAITLDKAVKSCGDNPSDEPLFYSGLSYFKLGDQKSAQTRFESLAAKFEDSRYLPKVRVLLEMLK